MSLEQSFNQRLTLGDCADMAKQNHQGLTLPGSGGNPPPGQSGNSLPSPAPSSGGSSGGGGGFNFKSFRGRSKSPVRSPAPPENENHNSGRPTSPTPPNHHLARGQSAPGVPKDRQVRVTKKIFNNWRSACGKTKDKTKDLIRRWKTLPENHPEFENAAIPGMSPPPSSDGGGGPNGTSKSKRGKLTKKMSEAEPSDGMIDPGCGVGASFSLQQKSSTGWTVHVWSTHIQRGMEEDENFTQEEAPPPRDHLSEFQKVKLIHFLHHVLDMNRDGVLERDDFVALNQRIRHFKEWSPECIEFHILKEVHSGFLECFLNQPLDESSSLYYCSRYKETRQHVTYDDWLDVWGELLHGVKSLAHLPLWLQYFPKILFQLINKSGSGLISKEELRGFYTMFLGIDFREVNQTLDSIYAAMTDDGSTKITYGLFKLCFTNFLLGKYPHGPGQYLFGICSPQSLVCAFPIDYSALNTLPDDLEPYDPEQDKDKSNRRSVIV